jgi:protein-arginine kinase activator protein McsA
MQVKPPLPYITYLPQAIATLIPKYCSECQQTKIRRDFNKNKATPDGLQYVCRTCQQQRQRAKKAEEREAKKKPELVEVTCPVCQGKWKSESVFLRTHPRCKRDCYTEADYGGRLEVG